MAEGRARPHRVPPLTVVVVAVVATWLGLVGCGAAGPQPAEPGSDTRQQAQTVMPFDLTRTTHTFIKTPTGGVEQVVANDPADAANTDAIRAHLAGETRRFSAGDYSDPARIHGADMPGLAQVQAGAARISVRYEPVAAGAQITYDTAEPTLVAALHTWFDAQSSDHDMPGMGG